MREWFRHDIQAHNDPKLRLLRAKGGLSALGLYWHLVASLYEHDGSLTRDVLEIVLRETLDRTARVNFARIMEVGLFIESDGGIYSERVIAEVSERNDKSGKASESAKARWKRNANALNPQSERNANTIQDNTVHKYPKKDTAIASLAPFEELWNLYGKKTDRKDAERAWRKLTDGEKERALQSVAAYVASTPDKQYRKHLATWLNKKSFDNEINPRANDTNRTSGERVATTDYEQTAEDYARELIANRPMDGGSDLRLAGSIGSRDTGSADNPNTDRESESLITLDSADRLRIGTGTSGS